MVISGVSANYFVTRRLFILGVVIPKEFVLLWWAMCDHFARELIKVAVVQICQEAGFQSIQSSALESLSDILIKCLLKIYSFFLPSLLVLAN